MIKDVFFSLKQEGKKKKRNTKQQLKKQGLISMLDTLSELWRQRQYRFLTQLKDCYQIKGLQSKFLLKTILKQRKYTLMKSLQIWRVHTLNINNNEEQKNTEVQVNNAIKMMIGSSNMANIFGKNLRKIFQQWKRSTQPSLIKQESSNLIRSHQNFQHQ